MATEGSNPSSKRGGLLSGHRSEVIATETMTATERATATATEVEIGLSIHVSRREFRCGRRLCGSNLTMNPPTSSR